MDRKNTAIWSFYDFATTPVAFAVNAMYLPLLILSLGGTNLTIGILPLITGIVAAVWTPFLGTLIDKSKTPNTIRKGIVFLSSLFAGISIIVLANSVNLTGLFLSFTTMSISIQSGWTAMNSYLSCEGEGERMGSLSGIGITMGYLGGAFGAGGALLIELTYNRTSAMIFVGIFLFIFAIIPSLFLTEHSEPTKNISSVIGGLKAGGKEMWNNSSVRAYLVGSILWGDAISTVVTFASILAIEVLLIPTISVTFFLATALPAAMVGAYVQGKAGDRFGLVRLQRINLILWMVGIFVIIIGGNMIPSILVTSGAGFVLGGNLALSRGLFAKIIPDGMEGRFFGISAIFVFFGGAIGPLLTGFIADLPGMTLQIALVVPLLFVIASIPTLNYIKE